MIASAAMVGSTPITLVCGEKYLAARIVPLHKPPPPSLFIKNIVLALEGNQAGQSLQTFPLQQ